MRPICWAKVRPGLLRLILSARPAVVAIELARKNVVCPEGDGGDMGMLSDVDADPDVEAGFDDVETN